MFVLFPAPCVPCSLFGLLTPRPSTMLCALNELAVALQPSAPVANLPKGVSMRKFHLVVGSPIPNNKFLIYGLTACASMLLFASRATAESNRSFAALHIQVTLVPTVQTSSVISPKAPESGTVSFDLKPKNNPAFTQQTAPRPMLQSRPHSSKVSGTSDTAGAPAVLETLTIVAQ